MCCVVTDAVLLGLAVVVVVTDAVVLGLAVACC